MADLDSGVIAVELGGAEGARLRWAPRPADDANGAAPPSPWELDSEPDWRRVDSIRLISALFEDGGALGVALVRPGGARAHDTDVAVTRLIDAEGEGTETSEALLSVEYDAHGAARRLGLELWTEPDSAPLRVAADRAGEPASQGSRETIPMRLRLAGTSGAGLYEVLRPHLT
jgi:hypothetical protein